MSDFVFFFNHTATTLRYTYRHTHALHAALPILRDELPARLAASDAFGWSPAIAACAGATNLFVLGRGYGLAAAQEAALKFKETCALHAEAFSAAEVRHGPMAIIGERFPILEIGRASCRERVCTYV